jgi:hypothetical protein
MERPVEDNFTTSTYLDIAERVYHERGDVRPDWVAGLVLEKLYYHVVFLEAQVIVW